MVLLEQLKQISGDKAAFPGDHDAKVMSENTVNRPCVQWVMTLKPKFVGMDLELWRVGTG
jgi:hypothetical protein